jgi:hypothetical protein
MKKVDGNGNGYTFTINGLQSVLRILKIRMKLTVVEMQLPYVKELSNSIMGTRSLFDLGVGDRGAQFIAENLKNLTYLYIGKQWNDSADNRTGDHSAATIAEGLKTSHN